MGRTAHIECTICLVEIAKTCLVETVHLVRPSSAPKSKSASVHNSEALSKKPSNVRIGYIPTMPSFKHIQQSRTRLKSAPPLLREIRLGKIKATPNPTFNPSLYHKRVKEHGICMPVLALHRSEADSLLSARLRCSGSPSSDAP